MKKKIGYLVPLIMIASLMAVSGKTIYNEFFKYDSKNVASEELVETVISDTKYVLKDPVEMLEKQSDDVKNNSDTEESNRLEDIINVISENTNEK